MKGSFKRACQQSCDHSIVLKLAKKVYRFALSFLFFFHFAFIISHAQFRDSYVSFVVSAVLLVFLLNICQLCFCFFPHCFIVRLKPLHEKFSQPLLNLKQDVLTFAARKRVLSFTHSSVSMTSSYCHGHGNVEKVRFQIEGCSFISRII